MPNSDHAIQLPLAHLALDPITKVKRQRRNHSDWVEDFMERNPQVELLLLRLAREARAAGAQKVGMKYLWERLRWEYLIQTGEKPALNNNFTADYSRLLQSKYPDLEGFFETRDRKMRGIEQ